MAIAGFVVGLVGLLTFWLVFVGLVISIVGLVLSIVGRRQALERGAPGGLATAGIAVSAVGVAAGLIFTILVIAIVDNTNDDLEELEDIFDTTTDFNSVVVGLWMLRDRVMQPIRRIRG